MHALQRLTIGLFGTLCCANGAPVFADDGLRITIQNDSTDKILVTVYDQSTQPPRKVLASTPVYGSASLAISVSLNAQGQGQLSWWAVSADPDMRQCGHGENAQLTDGMTVAVHADDDCDG